MNFDIEKIRKQFPILDSNVYGKKLVYLDNGATTQKPIRVINAITDFYHKFNSNIHRGVHYLSDLSTTKYEEARKKVADFINASTTEQIIFTKGTTDAINLVAFSFGEKFIQQGDEIIVSEMEHHSNIVPWKMLCERKGATLKVIPFDDNAELSLDKFKNLISKRTKIIAITYVSNSLGTVNPVKKIINTAHEHNIPVLIDAAQAIQHIKIDVEELDCDFLAFSGHKIYAETGIGVLYGKKHLLEQMPPYQGGGDMIKSVSFDKIEYADLPLKYEAGTNNYVAAVSLGEAIDFINSIGLDKIALHEKKLLDYATEKLSQIDGLRIIGNAENKVSVISFVLDGIHHFDVGTMLDKQGIAVRTGMHCTEPVMKHFGISGTVRASFAVYNTIDEIDILAEAIVKVQKIFY